MLLIQNIYYIILVVEKDTKIYKTHICPQKG